MKIGFLTCPGTMPGSPTRRDDAFEHDHQVAAIRPALLTLGGTLFEIDWRAPLDAFAGCQLVLVGTPWDYHDDEHAFLAKLELLESAGIMVCNSPALVRWNSRKTYLRDLADCGAATIPTLWVEHPTASDLNAAFEAFGCDTVVAKRQVGAGAEGQSIHRQGEVPDGWAMAHPAMIQPFLPQIAGEGEISFLFIDGAFSHALVKRPAAGDYRVQSLYGGTEQAISPAAADLAAAQAIIAAIPYATPLYARIDMVRGDDGALLLMEAELIEPYLYPLQGPELGPRLAEAIARRIEKR